MAINFENLVVESSKGAGSGVAYGSGASNHVNQESQSFVMDSVTPAYGEGMTSSPLTCVEIKFYGAFITSSSRHRRDAYSMAWRCRFLAARPSQDGRVIAEKRLSEELSGAPDALVDFHTGAVGSRCAEGTSGASGG